MFGFIKRALSGTKVEEPELEYTAPTEVEVETHQPKLSELKFTREYDPDKRNLMVMDDQKGMVHIFVDELESIEAFDVYDRFNIMPVDGVFSAFKVERYLAANPDIRFDIAFLDMTLGGIIDGVEYDGIDVAIMLKKNNPYCEIQFLTGHIMNERVSIIFDYMTKFKTFFGEDIDDKIECNGRETYRHIIPKTADRAALAECVLNRYEKDVS